MPSPEAPPQQATPFPAWSLTLPPPLLFPRDLYADALTKHSDLIGRNLEPLLMHLREAETTQPAHTDVRDLVAIIQAARGDAPESVRVEARGDAAFWVGRYRGILAPMLLRPPTDHLFIVVTGHRIVSLHDARLEDRTEPGSRVSTRWIGVRRGEIAFEPLGLEHYPSGDSPWTVTSWKHPDGERRWAWAPHPPEPATDDEAIDRVVARFEERIRRELWAFLAAHGAASQPLAMLMSVRDYGDAFEMADWREAEASFARMQPALARAIREHAAPGRVPVWVALGRTSGLRWLGLRADQREDEPLRLLEVPHMPLCAVEPEPPEEAPEEEPASEPAPPRKRSAGELLDWMLIGGIEAEINLRLIDMPGDQLDREISEAGFDPKIERATPWLREKVIQALLIRSSEEERAGGS